MTFKAGDRVVYPHHGAAIVEKKEKKKAFGEEKETWSCAWRMARWSSRFP